MKQKIDMFLSFSCVITMVQMKRGKCYFLLGNWYNEHCDTPYGYICKRQEGADVVVTDPPTPAVDGSCPPGYIGIGAECSLDVSLIYIVL